MILDFNADWQFCREGCGWEQVNLPHDAMLLENRSANCRNSGNTGYFPGGKYRYKKTFSLTADEAFKALTLHFEGVYQNCLVYCNGSLVGRHYYGYTAFDVDLTDSVRAGKNTLEVKVDNSLEPNCRWYTGSGIYRPVTLMIRARQHIQAVRLRTVQLSPVKICVEVDAPEAATVEIRDGAELLACGVPGILELPDAKLWSAQSPKLYTCIVKTPHDETKILFGVRTLTWSAKTGLCVNGERVLLRGGCIHHDHGVLGACEYRDAERRRLKTLKEQGFNAVRIAHHPASQITLELCDELGLYVMNELFDGWYWPKTYHDYSRRFETDWKDDMAAMVTAARNHPCVILYSVGNEVSETSEPKGMATCQRLVDYLHVLDDTRPVTAGINVLLNVYAKRGVGVYRERGTYCPEPLPPGRAYREKKSGSAFFNATVSKLGRLLFLVSSGKKGDKALEGACSLDIIGLNYASSQYDYQAEHHPKRMLVGSETMAADLPYNWARVQKYTQLIGDFVWSAWDYLGEACIGDWTYHSYPGLPLLAGQGMIDITGKPLATMYFMQIVWGLRKTPFLCVRPLNHAHEKPEIGAWQFTNAIDSWNWQGYEGEKAVVEVYSAGSYVRLSLNGRPIGKKKLKDFRAIFHTVYCEGTLLAEALDETGRVLSTCCLQTGSKETILTAVPERTVLSANGQDLCYIPIEFTDDSGQLKPSIEQPVSVNVEGCATLVGFGSACCKTDETFTDTQHTSYRGRCLAVLRAGREKGVCHVTITSADTDPVDIQIEVN